MFKFSFCTSVDHLDESLMPAARVTNNIGAGDTLTVSWPTPENVNFLRVYVVSYTSGTRPTPSGRRQRQAGTPMSMNVSATMTRAVLLFQPFSNYMVDVSAVYAPPPSGNEVAVILLPTTTFTTPERSKKLSGVANHTQADNGHLHTNDLIHDHTNTCRDAHTFGVVVAMML